MITRAMMIWCNGRLCSADEPVAGVLDRGLRVGLGIFDTMLALDGRLVARERHFARLAASARRFEIELPGEDELRSAIEQVMAANDLGSGRARVRVGVSGGAGDLTVSPGEGGVCWVEALRIDEPVASVTATLCPWTRNEHDPLAGHKCSSYAANLVARSWAARQKIDEPLFANSRGELCEGTTTNVFLVLDGVARTPLVGTGCLPGVTRAVTLELGRAHGVPVEEGEFVAARLADAEEVFLTSATRGIQPVRKCGNRDLPAPGPVTRRLQEAYQGWLREQVESTRS